MKKIAIILVDWNGLTVTRACLDSLLAMPARNNLAIDIFVVDNGSAVPVAPLLKNGYPTVHFIRSEENLGFTGGNNLGLDHALATSPDYILFLNNDTVVTPDFLFPLVNFLETHPEAGAVQPKIFFYPDKKRLWNNGNMFYRMIGQTHTRGYGKADLTGPYSASVQPWLTGCAFMIRAALCTAPHHLRFDNRFFALYEDVDLSFKIRALGYALYLVPDSVIYHHAGYSANTRTKGKEGYTHPYVVYLNCRNRIWITRHYTPWYFMPTAFLYLFFYFLLLIPYFSLRGRTQKAAMVLRAIKDGLVTSLA
jgi:GT2 family glycosyltransferase